MRNIIDLMNDETSIVSLYEASLLDIEGTIEAGTEYYKEAEKELTQLVKEFTNVRNWKKYNIYCYDFMGGCNALGKVLGNNADLFEIIVDKYYNDEYIVKFIFKAVNNIYSMKEKHIFARIDLPLDKYSKKRSGITTGPDIPKIIKEFVKYFSDVETLKEFLKKNLVKGYFYDRA